MLIIKCSDRGEQERRKERVKRRGKYQISHLYFRSFEFWRHFILALVLTLFCVAGFAQQQVTVRLNNRPIVELFESIEKQSSYRIFCDPEVMDSLLVSIDETNVEPASLIRQALKETPYQTSVFKNAIYIVKDKVMITALPENFYGKTTFDTINTMPLFEREKKAVSETLIYAIGNPNAPTPQSVIMTGIVTNFKNGEPMAGVTLLCLCAVFDPVLYTGICAAASNCPVE